MISIFFLFTSPLCPLLPPVASSSSPIICTTAPTPSVPYHAALVSCYSCPRRLQQRRAGASLGACDLCDCIGPLNLKGP